MLPINCRLLICIILFLPSYAAKMAALHNYRTVITAPAFTRPVICAPFSANGVPALG